MNSEKSIAPALDFIRAFQQHQWNFINAKPQWTRQEFEIAFYCHNEWVPEVQDWCYSRETVEKFAFDPRTPNDRAKELRHALKQYRQQ
ncbi:hypothetical protein ACFPMF_07370 [Larkinella bovis]|uniref:Uncharacterized protein n=1 Tax=Larkinella bovis TaxID=683041 RepID=A0ABW0I734_9BACT